MLRPKVIQILAVFACVALIAASATVMPAIKFGRKGLTMTGSADPLENAPPEYAFAVQALGAFRGLITDIAFVRAEQFKEQGRFYDAKQLAEWICALQPRFPSVWEFAAWNLSWNISVTTYTAEERWNWVYNGAKLLRDQGIPNNPRAVNLYKQLAWTFCNKMSESIDDHHMAYKANWAWRMHLLLGPPAPPAAPVTTAEAEQALKDQVDPLKEAARLTQLQNEAVARQRAEARGEEYKPRVPGAAKPRDAAEEAGATSGFERARSAAYDRLKLVADAAPTLTALYAQFPETRAMVQRLRELDISISDSPLTEDDYWRDSGLAFRFFERYRRVREPMSAMTRLLRKQQGSTDDENLRKFDEIVGVTAKSPAGAALVHFLQRKVLLEVYRNDPAHMLYLVKTFGPLDWRSVDAQALYWVTKGIIAGGETVSTIQNDKTNTARLIFFCLRNIWLRGRITFEPNPERIHLSYLTFTPDEDFIEPMHQAYLTYAPLIDPDPGNGRGVGDTFRSGHVNFLAEAVRMLYLSGRERDAAHYYNYLQTQYGIGPNGEPVREFGRTLYDFVIGNYFESISAAGYREAMIALASMLHTAFTELAGSNLTRYARLVRRAEEYHTVYMKDKSGEGINRMGLPPYRDIEADVFYAWFRRPSGSPTDTIEKVRLWGVAPLTLKQRVYDALAEDFKTEAEYWDFDVTRAFPEPPGMKEYREQNPDRSRKPGDETETLPMKLDQ